MKSGENMPRGLTIEQAAEHCGLSVSGFRHWLRRSGVRCKIKGTHRYDIRALDAALDRLSGLAAPAKPADSFEEWEARRNAAKSAASQVG
jgi:hypothetical protein